MSSLDRETRKNYRLKATGKCYLCAISTSYDSTLPSELSDRLDPTEFQNIIEDLSEKGARYWPCPLSYYCGIFCSPVTFGLSLLIPHVCLGDAE
jgi:hypothetical protein